MMKYLRPYYIIALLVGGWIIWFNARGNSQAEEFYGFAENRDTEVNFNYPVVVKHIHVTEGEEIQEGALLFHLQRVQAQEELAEESFRISELKAESKAWRAEKAGALKIKEAEYQMELKSIDDKIDEISRELAYKKKIYSGINSLSGVPLDFSSMENEITDLKQQKKMLDSLFFIQRNTLEEEMKLGADPYNAEIQRMEARMTFDEAHQVQEIEIRAPFTGLVGNIQCKEEEHIPSFKTLMNFYEPNPTMVKGFIHEDLILKVKVGDILSIRSTTNPEIEIKGTVSGMGSRIIEIPSRLRKIPELKTYGREVLISIPESNSLIQKEKVIIEVL
jgi:multidrug resistance efflux pump